MRVIPEFDFKETLKKEGFSLPNSTLVGASNAGELNFPVAVKVSSEKITHKTEEGAVLTGIKTKEELDDTVSRMQEKFLGERIYIEEMAPKGTEVIIGLLRDNQFGSLILLGIGGFFSEVIRDVTFKSIPIDIFDAEDMLGELKFEKIFDGYRGLKASREELVKLLLKVSEFSRKINFSQVDFNPVFLYENSYVIVDAKLVV